MFRTDSWLHAASRASAAKKSQSFLCPRAQTMTLMLDPPPSTLPIFSGMARPLRCGLGWATKAQSRSLPRFRGHCPASMTLGISSLPPASSRRYGASIHGELLDKVKELSRQLAERDEALAHAFHQT